MKKQIFLILLILSAKVSPAQNVIPFVAIASSSGSVSGMPTANIINSSGMSAHTIQGSHNSDGAAMWSCNYQWSDVNVTFDLGAEYNVDKMYVWNFNQQENTGNGMKNVKIQYSLNNSAWSNVAAPAGPGYVANQNYPFQLAQASGESSIAATNLNNAAHLPVTVNAKARYIRIVAAQMATADQGNWGGNATGLSEVIFTTTDNLSAGSKIEIDAAQVTNTCGHLLFGGAQLPSFTHSQTILPLYEDAGMNAVRADFWIESIVPSLASPEDYKNNINDCRNADKWNYANLELLVLAKKAGMTTMAIIAYCPSWLSYTGNEKGVPRDMDIYADIVRKIYSRYHQYIDYVEFYNEPGYFFSIQNSPYTSVGQALADMYVACYDVVQAVSPGKPMGGLSVVTQSDGGVGGSTNTDFFADTRITHSNFNFYSHHVYSDYGIETSKETVSRVKNQLAKFGFGDLPVWFTEWSSSINSAADTIYYTGSKSHTFVGKCLVNWMRDGLTGAHHWNFLQGKTIGTKEPGANTDAHGMYAWNSSTKEGSLLPKACVFKLLSRSLGLGKNTNRVLQINNTVSSSINAIALKNADGNLVVVAVNEENTPRLVRLEISNFAVQNAEQYTVTFTQKGETSVALSVAAGNPAIITVEVPAASVTGVKLTD
jgi:hypothetical protein